ncbi:zinc metallopeptidase [Vallitaleaceae bacterium 9-2]
MFYNYTWYASYIVLIPAILFTLYASSKVNSTFKKYSKYANRNGYTGAEVARKILDDQGLYDVRIEHIPGDMTDHYDPRTKVVRLSDTVHSKNSLSAISVAAHECGHAIQHQQQYVFLSIRHAIVPGVNLVNKMSMPMIMIGVILGGFGGNSFVGYLMIQLGILFFAGAVLFQFVTLPVEFNASKRALQILDAERMLSDEEMGPAKKVLNAAALTYVAAAATAVLSLIRLILVFGGRRDD